MKDNQAKYPQLRFKGFTDPWEQREFKTLYKKVSEKNDLTISKNCVISVAQMRWGRIPKDSTEEYMRSYNVLRVGDIAFEGNRSKKFAFGRFVENTIGTGLVSHVFDVFRPIESMDLGFWKYYIHDEGVMRNILRKSTQKSTMMTNLVSNDFMRQQIRVPESDEQQQIGVFFKQLDKTIALHQRKLAKLKELKQGYLQKLFPKNGSKFPQLRFAGFADAWEERKLSEIVDIYDGTHQTPIYTDSGVKFVSVENISNLETKKYISQEAYNKEYAKKQAQKGDVLMTRIGDIGTSRVIETEEPLAYYVTLSLLKPKKIESNFLSWLISSPEVQRNIWKRTLHIAFPKKINLGEINQVEVMIPKNKEQQKIGSFFKQLDDTIALHQRKLEKLQELKKGYLQKMFC